MKFFTDYCLIKKDDVLKKLFRTSPASTCFFFDLPKIIFSYFSISSLALFVKEHIQSNNLLRGL